MFFRNVDPQTTRLKSYENVNRVCFIDCTKQSRLFLACLESWLEMRWLLFTAAWKRLFFTFDARDHVVHGGDHPPEAADAVPLLRRVGWHDLAGLRALQKGKKRQNWCEIFHAKPERTKSDTSRLNDSQIFSELISSDTHTHTAVDEIGK